MKNGFELPLVIEAEDPPRRLVTRIATEGKAPFGGTWTYDIIPEGSGSRLTITEDGWVGNPFFRVISRIMGYHGTIDSYLRAVAKRFGSDTKPIHGEGANK